jgi:hypothetical protein
MVDEAVGDGESSVVGASRHCLASLEISMGLSVGFGTTDEPHFTCSLLKALAVGALYLPLEPCISL